MKTRKHRQNSAENSKEKEKLRFFPPVYADGKYETGTPTEVEEIWKIGGAGWESEKSEIFNPFSNPEYSRILFLIDWRGGMNKAELNQFFSKAKASRQDYIPRLTKCLNKLMELEILRQRGGVRKPSVHFDRKTYTIKDGEFSQRARYVINGDLFDNMHWFCFGRSDPAFQFEGMPIRKDGWKGLQKQKSFAKKNAAEIAEPIARSLGDENVAKEIAPIVPSVVGHPLEIVNPFKGGCKKSRSQGSKEAAI